MLEILAALLALVTAITVHEAAHAWMADRLGDPTARLMGRLSLNPMVHYDPVGTTLLLVLIVLRSIGIPVIPFGWAKPVPFDPYNLKNPRRDGALISLAGPLSNLSFAVLFSILYRIASTPFSPLSPLSSAFEIFVILNVVLAIFNLVPIHPLDGGKILAGLLPPRQAREFDQILSRYGVLILIFLIFPFGGVSILFAIMSPILNIVFSLLLPGNAGI